MWEGRGKEEECVSSGRSEARHLRQCGEWKAGEREAAESCRAKQTESLLLWACQSEREHPENYQMDALLQLRNVL